VFVDLDLPHELRLRHSIAGRIGRLFTLLLCTAAFLTAAANDHLSEASPSGERGPQRLTRTAFDRQIAKVLQNPEFDWRQPDLPQSNEYSTLRNWTASVVHAISSLGRRLAGELHRLLSSLRWRPGQGHTTNVLPFASGSVSVLTYLLLAAIAGIAILFSIRLLKSRKTRRPRPAVARSTPALEREGIAADELPDDEWYQLAREKIASGDLRQAQRALFLAILSCLAFHRFITIERWKSNCDYENELGRRAKHLPDLPRLYAQSRVGFERCWYGEGTLTSQDLEAYGDIYERIKHAAA
jgi:hypothetical protein